MSKYLNSNPIAQKLYRDFYNLNESKETDSLLEKICGVILDTFKKIVFDLSNNKARNPDEFREKLSDLNSSKNVASLISKMKDYVEESPIFNSKYAKVKQMYIKGLNATTDSLKRVVEIEPSLGDRALENFKELSNTLINTVDRIAVDRMKKMEESLSISEDNTLNESISIGFEGRVETLKKKLVNLISESKGKDSKNGFGRDWQRIFSQLNQKLDVISSPKKTVSEKDRKSLAQIEKEVDNLSQEFFNSKVRATEVAMKQVLKDDKLLVKFDDLSSMLEDALDLLSKANVEEGMVDVNLREEMEEMEAKISEKVFPIRMGNKDSDKKFKGSGLIQSIQKSLIEAFPPVKNLMQNRGESDGKFGPATSLAIKSIQGIFGNKNMNGEIDRSLLDSFLSLDQISEKNKENIKKSLDSLRLAYSVSEAMTSTIGYELFETKYVDVDDLEAEIKKNLETVDLDAISNKNVSTEEALASSLAKLLRVGGFNKNAEAEDFLREDDTLKNSYPKNFVENWMEALESNKDEENKDSFFWVEREGEIGYLYALKRIQGGYKKPYNWEGWKKMSNEENETSRRDFADWYTSYYGNFGGIKNGAREKVIKDFFEKISRYEEKSEDRKIKRFLENIDQLVGLFGKNFKSESFDAIKNGFVDKQTMDTFVKIAKKAAQVDDESPDLGAEDFRILTIIVSLCLGNIAYNFETEKWDNALDVLKDKALKEPIMDRISKDRFSDDFKGGNESVLKNLIQFKSGNPIVQISESPKQLLLNLVGKGSIPFQNLIKKHIDRISLKDLEGKNIASNLKIYIVKKDI